MNRNIRARIFACVFLAIALVLGFGVLGGRKHKRQIRSDAQTVIALKRLAEQVNAKWISADRILPKNLETLSISDKHDPVDGESFSYRVKSGTEYELCATFRTDNQNDLNVNTGDPWIHPRGPYCFQFDASRPVPQAP